MKTELFNYNNTIYTIIIGKNKNENWAIIDDASGTDLWFHISEMPSLLEQWDIINPDYCWINFLNSVRPEALRLIKTRSKII